MRDHVFHECNDAMCNIHERQHHLEGRLEQRQNENVAMKAIAAATQLQQKQSLFYGRDRPSTTTAKATPANINLKLELTMTTAGIASRNTTNLASNVFSTPKSGYISVKRSA